MDKLPIEVLSRILSYLPLSDRKQASLASHSLYEAATDPCFARGERFILGPGTGLVDTVNLLLRRQVVNLSLANVDCCMGSKGEFLKACKESSLFQRVENLSLGGCDLTESIFTSIITSCTRLRSLDLSTCDVLFMSGLLLSTPSPELLRSLVTVERLGLGSLRYLSDRSLTRLIEACPRLTGIDLAGNSLVFHSSFYWQSESPTGGFTGDPSSAILSFDCLLSHAKARCDRITCLDLSRTTIDGANLSRLLSLEGLVLQELSLSGCTDLFDDGLVSACEHQTKLRALDITDCSNLTDKALASICAHLSGLERLQAGRCRQFSDASDLSKLESLRHLDLSSCYIIRSESLLAGLQENLILTTLRLSHCSLVTDELLTCCPAWSSAITELDLGSTDLTNLGVFAISAQMVNLESLSLARCQNITDEGLLGIQTEISCQSTSGGPCKCSRHGNEYSLNIFNLPKVQTQKGENGDQEKFHQEPITNLRRLRKLDLCSCFRLTDRGITGAVRFPQLTTLNLGLCPALTDVSLHHLAQHHPCLEDLAVPQCTRLTDNGLCALVRSCPRLSSLDVSSCDKITGHLTDCIFTYGLALRQLDVSACREVPSQAIDFLLANHRRLKRVTCRTVSRHQQQPKQLSQLPLYRLQTRHNRRR